METIRLLGEWLIAPLDDIEVVDFQCWRRGGKRRSFSPFLHLRVGQHDVMLDGYGSVWSFLDAIQPDMYRSMVNAAMKGDVEGIISFSNEIRALIDESQVPIITIQYEAKYMKIPNDIRGLDCYLAKSVRPNEKQEVSDRHQRLDFIVKIDTPFRNKDGIQYLPTRIYGQHPQIVMVREHPDSETITSFAYNPQGKDLRFYKMVRTSDSIIAKEILNSMIYSVSENTYPRVEGDNQDSVGMHTYERDTIELDRTYFLEV